MALLWRKKTADTLYEVRSAGKTIRLYSNGIFHSQWHPNKPLTGHLWDLLSLPAYLIDTKFLRSALILGVGGGAVIRVLNQLFDLQKVIGIDLDPVHLHIAERYFQCRQSNTQLLSFEAAAYLKRYKRQYDYIVDDVFLGSDSDKSDARRAIKVDKHWLGLIDEHLSTHGLWVANFENRDQFLRAKALAKKHASFKSTLCFEPLRYENTVGVFSRAKIKSHTLEQKLHKHFGEARTEKILAPFILN